MFSKKLKDSRSYVTVGSTSTTIKTNNIFWSMLELTFGKYVLTNILSLVIRKPINIIKNNQQDITSIFVSATRRRWDIKIPLCLSAPVRKSLI